VTFADGVLLLRTKRLHAGTQTVTVRASDYQETKNMETSARCCRTRASSTRR
jgi:hypothetical protein